MPPSMQATFQGTAAAFLKSLANDPFSSSPRWSPFTSFSGSSTKATFIHHDSLDAPVRRRRRNPRLLLCRTEFSVIALIGIILAHRIVKKNAIMMIDFALEAERKEGKSPLDAIYEACLLRFRPS